MKEFPLIEGKQSIYIRKLCDSNITYSKGTLEMFGYHDQEFNTSLASNFIHPKDKLIVDRISKGYIKHCIKKSSLNGKQYLNMTFRALKKDGQYIRVLRQTSPYQYNKKDKLVSNLSILHDISFMKDNDKIEWEIISNKLDQEAFKQKIYKEFTGFFTPRELDIVRLITNDLTNRQIASKLFISYHTVVTHRKNIFKKSNCHNSQELILFIKNNHIF